MKKLLLLGALLSTAAFAEGNVIEGRTGYDLSSKAKTDLLGSEKEEASKKGFELATEYRREVANGLELGVGIGYKQNNSKIKNESEGESIYSRISKYENGDETALKFGTVYNDYSEFKAPKLKSTPIYATARYNFKNDSGVNPYVKANLGYAVNSGKGKYYEEDATVTEATESYKLTQNIYEEDYKITSGIYYGVGVGVEYKGFTVDLSYNVNNAKIKKTEREYTKITTREYDAQGNYVDDVEVRDSSISSIKENLRHHTVTLSVGYAFKF